MKSNVNTIHGTSSDIAYGTYGYHISGFEQLYFILKNRMGGKRKLPTLVIGGNVHLHVTKQRFLDILFYVREFNTTS